MGCKGSVRVICGSQFVARIVGLQVSKILDVQMSKILGVHMSEISGGHTSEILVGQTSDVVLWPEMSEILGLHTSKILGCQKSRGADVRNLGGANVKNLGTAHVRNLGIACVKNLGVAYAKILGLHMQKSRGCICRNLLSTRSLGLPECRKMVRASVATWQVIQRGFIRGWTGNARPLFALKGAAGWERGDSRAETQRMQTQGWAGGALVSVSVLCRAS